MKSLEEFKNEIFCRSEMRIRKKRAKIKKITVSISCFCLAAIICIGVWQSGVLKNAPNSATEKTEQPENANNKDTESLIIENYEAIEGGNSKPNGTATVTENSSVIWGEQTKTQDNAFVKRNGKQVWLSLNEAFNKAKPNDVFAVSASFQLDSTFIYKGKTLGQYEKEAEEEKIYRKKLASLLKMGEALKYGEALYTTGTPDGEKWTKELYDEKVALLGTDILSRFIVDGEFLADEVEKEIAAFDDATAGKEYKEAYDKASEACFEQIISKAEKSLKNQQIKFERSKTKPTLTVFVTVKQFDSLKLDDLSDCVFGFATKDGTTDDYGVPTDIK